MLIESMPIIVISVEALAVEVAMDIPEDIAIVAVADAEVVMAIPDIDILSMVDMV